MKNKTPNHTCEYCKQPFYDKRKTARFCGVICYDAFREVDYITCKMCGDTFQPRATRNGRQIFCSIACKKNHDEFKRKNLPSKNCERCGREFNFFPSRIKYGNPRFCSSQCAGNMKKWQNERFTRVKTKKWSEIRKSILERDGYKCAKCGSAEKLTVHHIKRWVLTKDDTPSNLITLCRSCHWAIEWNGVACPVPPQ